MTFNAKNVSNPEDAERVSQFILDTFDDPEFTVGELLQIKQFPLRSIDEKNIFFWYVENEEKEIIATAGLHENELLSGGYYGDYMAIRKDARHSGLSDFLLNKMADTASLMGGRYIIIVTGALPSYIPAQKVFERNNFKMFCEIPHYYFQNEGAVMFIRYLQQPN